MHDATPFSIICSHRVVNFRETGSIQRKDASRRARVYSFYADDDWGRGRQTRSERGRERERRKNRRLTPCGVSLTLGSSATNWISSLTRVWSLSNRWEPEHPSCIKHPRHPVHPHPHRARSGPPLAAFLFRYVPLSLIRRSLPSPLNMLCLSFSSFPFLSFFSYFSSLSPFLSAALLPSYLTACDVSRKSIASWSRSPFLRDRYSAACLSISLFHFFRRLWVLVARSLKKNLVCSSI